MAKAAAVQTVTDEVVSDVVDVSPDVQGDEVATSQTVDLDKLRELIKAATDVAGYYGGATYEADKIEGINTLTKFGINFVEPKITTNS